MSFYYRNDCDKVTNTLIRFSFMLAIAILCLLLQFRLRFGIGCARTPHRHKAALPTGYQQLSLFTNKQNNDDHLTDHFDSTISFSSTYIWIV